jgi:hypothetical protein
MVALFLKKYFWVKLSDFIWIFFAKKGITITTWWLFAKKMTTPSLFFSLLSTPIENLNLLFCFVTTFLSIYDFWNSFTLLVLS